VWRAIYFHYLPIGVEPDAPPLKAQLGPASITWAAVSLADKLDTIVGLFAAGEKPTGSRDPYGLRRAAQGVVKILTDMPSAVSATQLVEQTYQNYGTQAPSATREWQAGLFDFLAERETHLLERRGFRADEVRAVVSVDWTRPHTSLRRVDALSHARLAPDFDALALLFKRAKNITKDVPGGRDWDTVKRALKEPAEIALASEIDRRWPVVQKAREENQFLEALNEIAKLYGAVDKFFVEVLVMAEDPELRQARLALLASLRDTILNIADIAEIAPETSG
jgi:glycyl-tRNA synthetase beta chain